MQCPNCGKEKSNIHPGKYKCTDCYYIFEISKKDTNELENSRILKLDFGLVILLPEIMYFSVAFYYDYEINEFQRPYFYFSPIIISCSCIYFIIYFMLKYENTIKESLIVGIITGIFYGFGIALFLLSFNYIFKTEVNVEYKLMAVSQGRAGSLNFKIRTSDNKEFLLNIRTKNYSLLNYYNKITLYQGIFGYYFGNIQMLKRIKIK